MLRVFFLCPLAAAAGAGAAELLRDARCRARARWVFLVWLSLVVFGSLWVAHLLHARGLGAGRVVLPGFLFSAAGLALILWGQREARGHWLAAGIVVLFGCDMAWHLRSNSGVVWRSDNPLRLVEGVSQERDALLPRSNAPGINNYQQITHTPVVQGFVPMASAFNRTLVPSAFNSVLRGARYWLSPAASLAPPLTDGMGVLGSRGLPGPVPVFVDSPESVAVGKFVEPGSFGRVTALSYAPERVELETEVPPPLDALLASTERIASSWLVQVDGVARPLVRINYFFRGVVVPPGQHRVLFEYKPKLLFPLLCLSYGTIAVLVVMALGVLRGGSINSSGQAVLPPRANPATHGAGPRGADQGEHPPIAGGPARRARGGTATAA